MSKGCLLFAFNNNVIDYVKLAHSSAINIQRLLNLPTTIVTDTPITFEHVFEHVVLVDKPNHGHRHFQDYEKTVKWINFERHQAYNLSPYSETLLLDADYVVASDRLNVMFELDSSFLCHKTSFNVSGQCFESSNKFGLYGMPMAWATVVYFKKNKISKNIFNVMSMVQSNYTHYANLYNFNHYPYRNDYALSIALNINSGHFINSDEYYIPWELASVVPEDSIETVSTDEYQITYKKLLNNKTQKTRVIINGRDLHVMGKKYLADIYED
jgi:hypothetical protein